MRILLLTRLSTQDELDDTEAGDGDEQDKESKAEPREKRLGQ